MSDAPDSPGQPAAPGLPAGVDAAMVARGLFELSPFSKVLFDPAGRIVAANPAFERLWGVSIATAPAGYTVLQDPELDRHGLLPVVRCAFEQGQPVITPPVRYDIARVSATGEGRPIWVEGHFHPIHDAAGRLRFVVVVHLDLTLRMEAEQALRRRTREFEEQAEEAVALNEQLTVANDELHRATAELATARDEAERERSRLQLVLDALPDGVTVFDRDWRFTYLNPAAARAVEASGRAPAALLGRTNWEEFPHSLGTAFHAAALRVGATRRAEEFDQYDETSGSWYENRIVPIPDGAVAIWRDVTARRKHDEAMSLLARASAVLASSLDYERTVQQLADLVVPDLADWCGVDLLSDTGELQQLAVAHVNPSKIRWARELRERYPPSMDDPTGVPNVLRTGRSEFYPEISPEMLAAGARDQEHREIIDTVGFRSAILSPLTARGRTLGVLSLVTTTESGHRYRPEDVDLANELARRAAIAIDNARLFRAEQAARERISRLQAATAALARGITVDDVTDVVLREGLATLDAQHGVVCRLTEDAKWLEIVRHAGVSPVLLSSYERLPVEASLPVCEAARTGTTVLLENRETVAAHFPAMLEVAPHTTSRSWAAVPLVASGRTLGALGFGFDEPRRFSEEDRTFIEALAAQCAQALERTRLLESERIAREEAEQANRAKMEFLATMSHELRTPLNAIGGYVELLEMGLRGPVTDEQRADLERIRRSQRTLQALIDDVLDFAKLESGRLRYQMSDVRLDEVIGAVEELVAPQLGAKELTLETRLADPALAMRADREKLVQILLNLLSNAIKFTERGRIVVEAAADGDDVVTRVHDTGIGIPPDKIAAVFEPFVQVDSGYTRRTSGTGLGLSISRNLARAMGGDLTAESTIGDGATFTLRMPRSTR